MEQQTAINKFFEIFKPIEDILNGSKRLTTKEFSDFELFINGLPEPEKVFDSIKELIIKEKLISIYQNIPNESSLILSYYKEHWELWKKSTNTIDQLFSHVNLYIFMKLLPEKNFYDPRDIPVHSGLCDMWREYILNPLKDTLANSLHSIIKNGRIGDSANFNVFASVMDSYIIWGIEENNRFDIYQQYFEDKFILDTIEFYKNESNDFINENGMNGYPEYVENCIDKECKRVKQYFPILGTLEKLEKVICKVLINDHIHQLNELLHIELVQSLIKLNNECSKSDYQIPVAATDTFMKILFKFIVRNIQYIFNIPHKNYSLHLDSEWESLEEIERDTFKLKKLNGLINNEKVDICVVKKVKLYRFNENSIKVLERLRNSEHSIKYYGCAINEIGDTIYIYTEYIENSITVSNYLAREKKRSFSNEELIKISLECSKELIDIHDKCNIIHRDIKSDNILLVLGEHGNIIGTRFINFRFSKAFSKQDPNYDSLVGDQTHMSPEVKLQNGNAGVKSDIWSFGCTLIELAGGNLRKVDGNGIPVIPITLSNYLRHIIQNCLIPNLNARSNSIRLFKCLSLAGNKQNNYHFPTFDEFDNCLNIREENIPDIQDSVVSLKCNYNFQKSIIQKQLPSSITYLELNNYNIELAANSIPSTVISLVLGSKFNNTESLIHLPNSIISLKFGTNLKNIDGIANIINQNKPQITLLVINDKVFEQKYPSRVVQLSEASKCSTTEYLKDCPPYNKDDWEYITSLGTGGFGSVFKAKNINGSINGVKVDVGIYAIKKIIINRFISSEVKTLEILNEDYSPKFYGCGKDDNYVYIYMEFLENGKSIGQILNGLPNNRFEEKEIEELAIDILKIIIKIHSNGIIHRDIKADHIFLMYDNDGKRIGIKFIDFGLSKVCSGAYTNYTLFVGTESHLAPEVRIGAEIGTLKIGKPGTKSDIWSFGCTLIEMAGGNVNDRDHIGAPKIPDHLSNPFKNILQFCLIGNVNGRFSAQTLLESLDPKSFNSNLDDTFIYPDNKPLIKGSIPDGTKCLSLPNFNNTIETGSIPTSVTKLTFKIFNQEFRYDDIPSSVADLDLGDEFDLKSNGDNIPNDTISKLKCGFKFKSVTNRLFPIGITELELSNFNSKLTKDCIPLTVVKLTLGSNFNDLDTLKHLPTSIISLSFGSSAMGASKNVLDHVNDSITSIIVNGKQCREKHNNINILDNNN